MNKKRYKKCEICHKLFLTPIQRPDKRWCGKRTEKDSCSYVHAKEDWQKRGKIYNKTLARKESWKKYRLKNIEIPVTIQRYGKLYKLVNK
jgi:hypothetical protein